MRPRPHRSRVSGASPRPVLMSPHVGAKTQKVKMLLVKQV